MLQYWRLNKNKWLGMAISWFFLFSVFTLVVLLRANLTMQILLINIAVSAGVVFLSFLLLLIYGFSGFRRKSLLFNSQPFDHLKSAGFNEELTASQHKFFFADKRLAGFIDGYRVKIDGDGKKLTIFVGTDAFPDPLVD